jgi:hypothetical protein
VAQRQFEGPVLEELLERVRREVGAEARIVAANRVRKGGVGGFFARQAYEVIVEPIDKPGPARPQPARPGPVRSVDAPASILDLADAVSDHERDHVIDLVDEHTVSTESRNFAEVLDRFTTAIGDEAIGGAVIDPPYQPLATEPDEPVVFEDDIDLMGLTVTPATPAPAMPAPRTTRDLARQIVRSNAIIERFETQLSRLGLPARLIPRGAGPNEMKSALVESLVRLPAIPTVPTGLGVVIVIVGANAAPVHLARDLAVELHLDPDDIVLATRDHLGDGIPAWLQMNDADTAHARRRSWQRRVQPTIVACSLPPMYQALRWAREMLDRLEPTITWAVVDAGWKREDITSRINALGGVDVLALDNLDDTVSPASALELGIPVGRLAREHASPLTWTELLLERVHAQRAEQQRAQSQLDGLA